MAEPGPDVRIDKWLWAARFFKTRALARAAVVGGKVQLQGEKIKPGRCLKVGDHLMIMRGDEHFEITVTEVCDQRLAAPLASQMYHENPASVVRREAAEAQRRLERQTHAKPPGRPGKRERRQIIGFLRGKS